jgi:hypothetical protein
MVEVNIKTKQAQRFLSSFGSNVDDLKVTIKDGVMEASIAFQTHFFKKKRAIEDFTTLNPSKAKADGVLNISELTKVSQFVKSCKTDTIKLKQTGSGKTLYVISGTSKLQLPVSATIISSSKSHLVEKLLTASAEAQWESFNKSELTTSGSVAISDVLSVTKMKGILSSNPSFKVTGNAGEKEFAISAGKTHEARLFTTTELVDPIGPNASVQSHFGPWLMESLGLLTGATATVHMGETSPIIFRQNDDLLLVVDQRV